MKDSNVVRIQLNLPALERLLGGDTTMEVELRHQIVNEFAGKHLLALMKEEAVKVAGVHVLNEARKVFDEELGKAEKSSCWWKTEATQKCRALVKETVKSVFQEEVNKFTEAFYGKETLHDKMARLVEEAIKRHVNAAIGDRVKEEVNKRLEATKAGITKATEAILAIPK